MLISYAYFQEDLEFPIAQLDVLAGELHSLLDLVISFVPLHLRLRFRFNLQGEELEVRMSQQRSLHI